MNALKAVNFFGWSLGKELLEGSRSVYVLGWGKFAREFLEASPYIESYTVVVDKSVYKHRAFNLRPIIFFEDVLNIPAGSVLLILTTDKKHINIVVNMLVDIDIDIIYIPLYNPRWFFAEISNVNISLIENLEGIEKINGISTCVNKTGGTLDYLFTGDLHILDSIVRDWCIESCKYNDEKVKQLVRIIPKETLSYFNELPVFTDVGFKLFLEDCEKKRDDKDMFLFIYRAVLWGEYKFSSFSNLLKFLFEYIAPYFPPSSFASEAQFVQFFIKNPFGLPLDLFRKWGRLGNSSIMESAFKLHLKAKDNICVYILRSWFKGKSQLINIVLNYIIESDVRDVQINQLQDKQLEALLRDARGGYWDDYGELGGTPYIALWFKYDLPFDPQKLKEEIRGICNEMFGKTVNAIHSSDDNLEARHYLSLIGRS